MQKDPSNPKSLLLWLTILLVLGLAACGSQADYDSQSVEQTLESGYVTLTAISEPEIMVLVWTGTPTATSTPPPTRYVSIAVPTFTLPPAIATPRPSPTPGSPTLDPTQRHPTAKPTDALSASAQTRIAYVTWVDGNREIYLADWDITHRIKIYRMTENLVEDTLPTLSPDGETLAFVSDRSGNREIYLMDLATGDVHQLTYRLSEDSNPTWSPDGTKIAFQSNRDGVPEIYVIETTCAFEPMGCPQEVVRLTDNAVDDLAPAWSPDGDQIAFMTSRTGNLEIYVMGADGSSPSRLTNNRGVDGFPTWSPDGSMIAYHSEQNGNIDIYMMSLDGERRWRLTDNPDEDIAPEWCGDSIIYMASQYGDFDINLIRVSSQGPQSEPFIIADLMTTDFDGFPSCYGSLR
jgi:Tol biopolymer transport system component